MIFAQYDVDENKVIEVVLQSKRPPTVYEVVQLLSNTYDEERDWGHLIHKMVKADKLMIEKDNTLVMPFQVPVEEVAGCGPTPKETLTDLLSTMPAPKSPHLDDLIRLQMAVAKNPEVHSPSHYTRGGIETIDFIEAKGLGFHLGNVVKYVSRAGFKQDAKVQDLEKAMWYLNREIERLKTNG